MENNKKLTTQDVLNIFDKITTECKQIMIAKNSDYTGKDGNQPFANFERCEYLGLCDTKIGMMVRMSDKFCRLCTYTKTGKLMVPGEGFEDAIKDMINYLILFYAKLEEENMSNSVAKQKTEQEKIDSVKTVLPEQRITPVLPSSVQPELFSQLPKDLTPEQEEEIRSLFDNVTDPNQIPIFEAAEVDIEKAVKILERDTKTATATNVVEASASEPLIQYGVVTQNGDFPPGAKTTLNLDTLNHIDKIKAQLSK